MRQKVNGHDSTIPQDNKRFCSSHQQFVSITGGGYVVFNNGLNRRWVCAACVARQERANNSKGKS